MVINLNSMESVSGINSTKCLAGSKRVAQRPSRRNGLSVRAQAGPTNPIGIHAQVWVGDWSKAEAEKAISGTKKAGYDLIERMSSPHRMRTASQSGSDHPDQRPSIHMQLILLS